MVLVKEKKKKVITENGNHSLRKVWTSFFTCERQDIYTFSTEREENFSSMPKKGLQHMFFEKKTRPKKGHQGKRERKQSIRTALFNRKLLKKRNNHINKIQLIFSFNFFLSMNCIYG